MASYDFNTPTTSTGYTDFPATIRDALDSVARMLDGTGDTNVPTGAKRINSGQGYRLEEWDGAAWQTRTPQLADALRAANNLSDLSDKAAAFDNIKQAATTSATGVVEKATTTEAQSGTATDKFPDVVGVKAHWDQRAASSETIGGAWDFTGGLSANGNAVLDDSNLAANGGTIPETDRANTFYASGDKALEVKSDGFVGISVVSWRESAGGHGLLNFYAARGTEASPAAIQAGDNVAALTPRAHDGTSFTYNPANNFEFFADGAGAGYWSLNALTAGSPTGGSQGPGTLNVEASYQNGKRNMAAPASSSDPGLAFGTWRTPAAAGTAGTMVTVYVRAETNGSVDGIIKLETDESGGTTPDKSMIVAKASSAAGVNGVLDYGVATIYVPPGGAYRVVNTTDPNSANAIESAAEWHV